MIRAGQRLIEPLAVRFGGDHLTREPLDHLAEEGFEVEQVEIFGGRRLALLVTQAGADREFSAIRQADHEGAQAALVPAGARLVPFFFGNQSLICCNGGHGAFRRMRRTPAEVRGSLPTGDLSRGNFFSKLSSPTSPMTRRRLPARLATRPRS